LPCCEPRATLHPAGTSIEKPDGSWCVVQPAGVVFPLEQEADIAVRTETRNASSDGLRIESSSSRADGSDAPGGSRRLIELLERTWKASSNTITLVNSNYTPQRERDGDHLGRDGDNDEHAPGGAHPFVTLNGDGELLLRLIKNEDRTP